jgi:hypothetical protein
MEPLQLSLFDAPSPVTEGVDIETRAEELADWVMSEMEKEGLDRTAQQHFLMRVHIRTLVDNYLTRIPPRQRWQFAVHLIDAIQDLELHSEGL